MSSVLDLYQVFELIKLGQNIKITSVRNSATNILTNIQKILHLLQTNVISAASQVTFQIHDYIQFFCNDLPAIDQLDNDPKPRQICVKL